MGTSSSVAELVGKLSRLEVSLTSMNGPVTEGAKLAKVIFDKAPGRPHKVAGGKVGVRYDVKGKTNATAIIRYTGPAHLVNNPTAAHPILPKGLGGKTRRARGRRGQGAAVASLFGQAANLGSFSGKGKRALNIEGSIRARAFHPGTRGKLFFQAAKAAVERAVPPVVARQALTQPLKSIFG